MCMTRGDRFDDLFEGPLEAPFEAPREPLEGSLEGPRPEDAAPHTELEGARPRFGVGGQPQSGADAADRLTGGAPLRLPEVDDGVRWDRVREVRARIARGVYGTATRVNEAILAEVARRLSSRLG